MRKENHDDNGQFQEIRTDLILKDYLMHVFCIEHFIVGLDCTGCYLFTEEEYDDAIAEWVEDFKDAMALDEQVSVCVIGRKSKFNFCDRKLLGIYVSKAVSARKKVLSDTEIQEIMDAYGVCADENRFFLDFHGTELFNHIKNSLKEKGFPIDDQQLNEICRTKPKSTKELEHLGVHSSCVKMVLQIINTSAAEQPLLRNDKPDREIIVEEEAVKLAHRCSKGKILGFSLLACSILLIFAGKWWMPLLPAVCSIFIMGRVRVLSASSAFYHFSVMLVCIIVFISMLECVFYNAEFFKYLINRIVNLMPDLDVFAAKPIK